MVTVDAPADGTNKVQSVEKTFQLTRADKDLLSRQDYDVQAWCMLLNDKVPFRMQWPQYANLQVNGIPVRAVNRPGSQLLGANGRDDGPIITPCTKDGINNISLTGCDARIFCVGVRIVRRQTVQQIFNLIPKEPDGEDLEDALARVCRCIGGGGATEADSDSDIEVVEDSVAINLRCPMSGSRIKIAGRFKPCVHMGCFDLEVFVQLNERSRKWQCPICLKNYSVEDIIIDPYLNRVTSMMRSCEEGITDIEVKQDGSWRLKAKSDGERSKFGELGKWHSPDGTVCVPNEEEVRSTEEGLKQVKQETALEHNHLQPGTKKNCNGLWEGSQPADTNNSSSNEVLMTRYVNMSSSGSGSSWDGEDTSISHQGGRRNLHLSAKNESEHDYVNSACGELAKSFSGTIADAEVIILSDSDEDDQLLISSTSIPIVKQSHSMPPAIADSFEVPIASHTVWPTPSGSQEGPGFQLLDLDDDVYDPIVIVDLQQASTSGPTPTSTNGYNLAPQTTEPASLIPDGPVGRPDSDMDYSLVDNPLANDRDDPSLQIFLPTRPSGTEDSREQQVVSKGILTGDWISLSLGDGGVKVPCGPTTTENGVIPAQQIPSGGAMDSLTDNDSDIPINVIRSRMTRRSGKVGKETSNSHNPINFMRPDETRSGVAGRETTDSDTPISLSITSGKASGHTSDCPSPTPFLKSRQAILSGRETGETSDSDTPINVLKSRMTTRSRKTGREASNSHNPINFTRSGKTIVDPAVIIPQQKRSVRPRVYVSFDSDSDPEWW